MRKFMLVVAAGALAALAPVAVHAQTYNTVQATATAGATIPVNLGPFDVGTTAGGTLFSDPVALGNVTVNSQGVAVFNVKIPASFTGVHHVEASGVYQGQAVKRVSPNFTVVRPAAAAGGLARTGSSNDTVPMALGGAGLAVLGAGLVVVAKRRRGAAVTA